MKLPNGYGSVTKLSGKRRKPYIVRKTMGWEYDKENDKMVQKYQIIGYASTKKEGLQMLSEYNEKPYDIRSKSLTFAQVYERYLEYKYKGANPPSRYNDELAFKYCASFHDTPMINLRREDLQSAIDGCNRKVSTKGIISSLLHKVYRYAIMEDICEKDYSQFLQLSGELTERGEPFSLEAIHRIYENRELYAARVTLILIYTGLRISELWVVDFDKEQRTITGGLKTKASKCRVAPVHDAIFDYMVEFDPCAMTVDNFRKNHFTHLMHNLDILYENGKKHTPHDTRHTFSWLADRYKIDDISKHILMGHSLPGDTEQSIYRHRTIEEIRTELNRIEFPPK